MSAGAKCMHRWVDPASGSGSTVGPYSCGRRANHKGAHAWEGNGAVALWSDSGELQFSVQRMPEGDRPIPEVLDAEDDALLAEWGLA